MSTIIGLQFATDLKSIHSRHQNIEHDEIRAGRGLSYFQPYFAVGCGLDRVGLFQDGFENVDIFG